MTKLRLGMIGIGNMGSDVARFIGVEKLSHNIELAAICDIAEERIAWAKETFGDKVSYYNNAEDLFKSGKVDAVYIATPHYDHPTLAIEAFKHNLHVITEKPAGVYTKAVREMNEAAEKSGLKLGIIFQCRTLPVFKKVKEMLSSGSYGEIRSVSWHINKWYRSQVYYDSGSWRATWRGEGGGVLLNQCPHNLDLLQWLCGMPTEVTAKCSIGQWHNVEIEDDVTAIFKYPNGAMGTLITSTGVTPGTDRLEIATDRGTFIVENSQKLIVNELSEKEQDFAKESTSPFQAPDVTRIEYTFPPERIYGHILILNAFSHAILNGGELLIKGKEGINSLTLSNAMYLSSWLNKTIELPIDEDLYYEELQKRVATSKLKNVKSVVASTASTYLGSK